MIKKKSLIYIAPSQSSFVSNDIVGLSRHYKVKSSILNWQGPIATISSFFIQFFWLIKNIFSAQAIVVSFGGYWALLPSILGKILNKKVFIILNGTDASSLARYNYGMLRKTFLRQSCQLSYKFAHQLLPVSQSLMLINNSFDIDSDKQGVLHYFPSLKTPYEVVYNGIDVAFWDDESTEKRSIDLLSVFSASQYYLKGGDLITSFASSNPNINIHIAGMQKPAEAPELINVSYHGKVSQDKLKELYQKTNFYLQLSAFEGFGCALCEAMLCGALPIVSNVNMLPEIIGTMGVVVDKKNVKDLHKSIEKAKALLKETSITERKLHVINNFSLQKRINHLVKIIG